MYNREYANLYVIFTERANVEQEIRRLISDIHIARSRRTGNITQSCLWFSYSAIMQKWEYAVLSLIFILRANVEQGIRRVVFDFHTAR